MMLVQGHGIRGKNCYIGYSCQISRAVHVHITMDISNEAKKTPRHHRAQAEHALPARFQALLVNGGGFTPMARLH